MGCACRTRMGMENKFLTFRDTCRENCLPGSESDWEGRGPAELWVTYIRTGSREVGVGKKIEEKVKAGTVHISDLKRQSASFVPSVVTLRIIWCHVFALIKRQCSLLMHTSVRLHLITTVKMLEKPGVRQMASLSLQTYLFCGFSDLYSCIWHAPLLLQH